MTTHDPIPARLAALKFATTPDLKKQWRDLFDSEPPPFNRRYLESRLAYRIQELAYGGLKPDTIRRLERLGEELDGGDRKKSRIRADTMPIAGTRLIREWQGVEQVVTVTTDGFEWQGRPYKSLSAIARRHHRHTLERVGVLRAEEPEGADMTKAPSKPGMIRKQRCAIYTRKSSEEGLEQEFNSLHAQREACEAYIASQRSEGWVLVRDQYDDGGISGGTLERPGLKRLLEDIEDGLVDVVRRLQDRQAQPLARRLRQAGRGFRPKRRDLCLGDAVLQHDHVDGPADTEHPAVLRAVRARGDCRADPRQGRRQPQEGHVDGRRPALRLPGREPEAVGRRGRRRARPLDLRPLPRDRIRDGTGAGGREARHPHATRQPDRQEVPLPDAEQPRLYRRGSPQVRELPRRARRDHRPRDVGPRSLDPAGEPAQASDAKHAPRRRHC